MFSTVLWSFRYAQPEDLAQTRDVITGQVEQHCQRYGRLSETALP